LLESSRQKWAHAATCVNTYVVSGFSRTISKEVRMYEFDPRWPDDPRDRDDHGRELSQGGRGGLSNPPEREPLDARDVFTRDLELPRGPERERVWARESDVRLRRSEVRRDHEVRHRPLSEPAADARQ
jgi:hypothetical protein